MLAVALASCSGGPTLPPADVLSRAAAAGRELESVEFMGNAEFGQEALESSTEGTVKFQGRMQNGGDQVALSVTFSFFADGPPASTMNGDLEVIVAGPAEMYVNVHILDSDPPHPLLGSPLVMLLMNQWWRIPSQTGSLVSPVTPDPKLLHMQTDVISVTEDKGYETVRGRKSHHYKIAIDPEKLKKFLEKTDPEADIASWEAFIEASDAKGEVWIDAETYVIHQLQWTIRSKADTAESMSLDLKVDFSNHNRSEPILPPENAKELEGMMPPAMLPDGMGSSDPSLETLTPDQKDLLRSLLE
jgi:hypothetical protein